MDRFCLIGPPQAHLDKLAELRELGVDQFAVYAMHDAKEEVIDAYGETSSRRSAEPRVAPC